MYSNRFETADAPQAPAPEALLRYSHRAIYGEGVKWLPPYRLIPSFASADGQSAVYRRRSQVVLTEEDSDKTAPTTSFVVGKDGMRVFIDQYGYARISRPRRSQQHVDPLSNLADGAADMERDAALTVCSHLNEHVEAMAFPQKHTPTPRELLVPGAVRAFPEPQPDPPRSARKDPRTLPGARASKTDQQEMADYLDARATWLQRRLAWEAGQRAMLDRAGMAARGSPEAMRENLLACLRDVLWPSPTTISFELRGLDEVAMDVLVPGLAELPDREAALAYGNRVSVRRMEEVNLSKLHNRHVLGLTVRLLGEIFAALPTVQVATVSALRAATHNRPQAYISSATVDRGLFTRLYDSGSVLSPQAHMCLQNMRGRFNVTGLGAFLPIEPYE